MLSLFAFTGLSLRVGRKDRSPLNYTDISGIPVEQFLSKKQKALIFYASSNKTLKPLTHTLREYNNDVSVAFHSPNPAENKFCVTFPCASAFLNGEHIRSTVSAFSPIDFEFWLSHTLCEPHFDVEHSEELRMLLTLPGNSLICVNCNERPKFVPPEKIVYYTTSQVANRINWKPKTGLHFYRHADREIFMIKNFDERYSHSVLVDIGFSNIKEKPFLAGLMVEHNSDKEDKETVEMAKSLATEHSDYFGVSVFADDVAGYMSSVGKFSHICGPVFVVFNTSDIRGPRWGEVEPELVSSKTHLSNLMGKIMRSDEKPSILSMAEEPNDSSLVNLVASNFEKNVFSNQSTVVLLYSSCNGVDKNLVAGFSAANDLFSPRGARFFAMDQGRNDVPNGLPLYHAYPQIVGIAPESKDFIQLNDYAAQSFVELMGKIGIQKLETDVKNLTDAMQLAFSQIAENENENENQEL